MQNNVVTQVILENSGERCISAVRTTGYPGQPTRNKFHISAHPCMPLSTYIANSIKVVLKGRIRAPKACREY